MSITTPTVEIKDVQFTGNSAMLLFLSNERTFIIPLDKFHAIAKLSSEEKKDFEKTINQYIRSIEKCMAILNN